MANPAGNPRIVEYGRQTRFGMSRACDRAVLQEKAAMTYSVRHALRVIMCKPVIDPCNPTLTTERILGMFGYKKRDKLSPAQVIAVRLMLAALDGDLNAARRIEYMLDGKP